MTTQEEAYMGNNSFNEYEFLCEILDDVNLSKTLNSCIRTNITDLPRIIDSLVREYEECAPLPYLTYDSITNYLSDRYNVIPCSIIMPGITNHTGKVTKRPTQTDKKG